MLGSLGDATMSCHHVTVSYHGGCTVQMSYVSCCQICGVQCRICGVSQSALHSPCHSVNRLDRNSGLVVVPN